MVLGFVVHWLLCIRGCRVVVSQLNTWFTCLIQSFFVVENCTYVIDSSLVKCFAVF
jgi:hypothetical protein